MPEVVPTEGYWFRDDKPRVAKWLLGQLWHCSDIMPWLLCEELDMPRGSTYAAAAHWLQQGVSR